MLSPIHICGIGKFRAGSPAPGGYLDWHEWARVQVRAGLKQRRCRECGRYRFPQEKCEHGPSPDGK